MSCSTTKKQRYYDWLVLDKSLLFTWSSSLDKHFENFWTRLRYYLTPNHQNLLIHDDVISPRPWAWLKLRYPIPNLLPKSWRWPETRSSSSSFKLTFHPVDVTHTQETVVCYCPLAVILGCTVRPRLIRQLKTHLLDVIYLSLPRAIWG